MEQGEVPTPNEMIKNTANSIFGESKSASGGDKKMKKTRRIRPPIE
jgi:hypothetical protein